MGAAGGAGEMPSGWLFAVGYGFCGVWRAQCLVGPAGACGHNLATV